ncbi:tetratricopeptide repeat protein [Streptomyces decoyicus]|uniref:tetratricopeptide repeat protein n=1 Tax=Streptomyces decoyicus TaxID=249567 RepID=UPI0036293D67
MLAQHLAENPDDRRAWIEIGHCHLKTEQPEQARHAADEALKLTPEDFFALILRAKALTSGPNSSWRAAEPVLREAVRADPHHWYGYTMLADAVCRMSMVRYFQANGSRFPPPHERAHVLREAANLAAEALRLGPEKIYAHEIAHQIATFSLTPPPPTSSTTPSSGSTPPTQRPWLARPRRPPTPRASKPPRPPTSTPPGSPPHRTPPRCSAAPIKPHTACCAGCGGWPCSVSAWPGRCWIWTCSSVRARWRGNCLCPSASACGTSCR